MRGEEIQRQYQEWDRMRLKMSATGERAVREKAAEAVDAINGTRPADVLVGGAYRFPAHGKPRPVSDSPLSAGTCRYWDVCVELIPPLREPRYRDEAILVAERVIREQLVEAGWSL